MAILFTKAEAGQCRWIVCDAVEGSRDTFGGRRVCAAAVSHPTSFCIEHRLRAYQRTEGVSAPPQEFAVLRREPTPETLPDLVDILS